MINNQPCFKETFVQFQKWLEETECWNSHNKSIFVTCGDWDLQVMLPKQCQLSNIDIPSEMKHWINIKKVGFEVLTVVAMKNAVFWVATLSSSEKT
jgi:ERI1 exoribonuclease 3